MNTKASANLSDYTIDFLIEDARIRLAFERAKKQKNKCFTQKNTISFLPLAAAGRSPANKSHYFSKDHNVSVTFSQRDEQCICDLYAQGFSVIEYFKNQKAQVCFDQQFYYLTDFNEQGFARLVLPAHSPAEEKWHTLAFTLKI